MTGLVTLVLLLWPLICTLLLGTGVTLWFWRNVPERMSERVMLACLCALVGFGLSGVIFFVWLNLLTPDRPLASDAMFRLEAMDFLSMILGIVLIRKRTKRFRTARAAAKLAKETSANSAESAEAPANTPVAPLPDSSPVASPPKWLVRTTILTLAIGLLAAMTHFAHNPHGDFDAVSMWNSRGQYIFLDPPNWHRAFEYGVHPDYPLLFPLTIARLWLYAGETSLMVPQGLAIGIMGLTLAMLMATITRVRGASSGLIAALATVAMSLFLLQGSQQYADAPTMMLTCGALCMLVWSTAWPAERLPVAAAFAGVLGGMNANIKNEGALIFVGIGLGTCLVMMRGRSIPLFIRSMISFVGGAAVFLVFLWLCKSQIQGENDVISGHTRELMRSQLLDPARHKIIWANILAMIFLNRLYFQPENWANVAAWIMPAWVVSDVFIGRRAGWRPGPERLAIWAVFLSLACVVGGYYAVYLVTPYDLDWHLRTSCVRLFLHVWPSIVLWAFLVMPPQLADLGPGADAR